MSLPNKRPVRDCAIPGCGPHRIVGRGMCSLHYGRLRTYGDPMQAPKRMPRLCQADGCGQASIALGYCQMHYLRVKRHGDPALGARYYAPPVCTIDGCESPSNRGRYCGLHRGRMERYGTPDGPAPRPTRRTHASGYELVKCVGHPVAQKGGWAFEHRVVLYDAIGGGTHPCHWCGRPVRWTSGQPVPADALVVDHLDDNRRNNDRTNLVPSCFLCNSGRSTYWGRIGATNA